MELAKLSFSLKELLFAADGDAIHIHSVLDAFKQLDDFGGYTLLRLAANSTNLIEIEPPKAQSANLFVSPLCE